MILPQGFPKTRFLQLRVPLPGLLDYAQDAVTHFQAAEVIGKDVRLVVRPDAEVASGAHLNLTASRRVEASGSSAPAMVIAQGSGSDEVLVSMVGIIAAAVTPSIPSIFDDDDSETVDPGGSVIPSEDEITQATARSLATLQADATKTVQAPKGFALSSSAVVFDGGAATMTHKTSLTQEGLVDQSMMGPSSFTNVWDNTVKRRRIRFTLAGSNSLRVWFPMVIPADFANFNNGNGGTSIWVDYKVSGTGRFRLTFVDSQGETFSGALLSSSSYASAALSFDNLRNAAVAPGDVVWVMATLSGVNGDTVDVESVAAFRYQPTRRFA